jgi:hypothetical protein
MSCSSSNIHRNDIGTNFLITIQDGCSIFDISNATVKNFIFKKPDGTILTVAASFYTNGVDGVLNYVTVSGDIDQAGTWEVQSFVEIPPNQWFSEVTRFKVLEDLV